MPAEYVSEWRHMEDGCKYETGTMYVNGKSFDAGGAWVGHGKALVYVSSDGRSVTGWGGLKMGDCRETGRFRGFHRSWVHCYRVTGLDGRTWCGRGSGPGMLLRLREAKAK